MKKVYTKPSVTVSEFHIEDICTTSGTAAPTPTATGTFNLSSADFVADDAVVDIF